MNLIKSSVIKNEPVLIGKNNFIDDNCILGSIPVHTPIEKQPNLFGIQIGDNNSIYAGSQIVKGIISNTIVRNNCIIGQMCIIGHDSYIGNRVKLMNSVKINGLVDVGNDTFIGTGSIVRNRTQIGSNCYIGEGSNVVMDSVPDNSFGYGNPFRIIRKNQDDLKNLMKNVRGLLE